MNSTNELLQAAKAVIDDLDNPRVCNVRYKAHQALRAAVERAEKQEAVGFDWWLSEHTKELMTWDVASFARLVWLAAQQAERERITKIVESVSHLGKGYIGSWTDCCDTIMERIDATAK